MRAPEPSAEPKNLRDWELRQQYDFMQNGLTFESVAGSAVVGGAGFKGRTPGGSDKLALGISEHLDAFASKQGASTWKSFPDPLNWKATTTEKLADPSTKILFNLDGPVETWAGAARAARGRGGATDWELLQIQQNPQWWGTIEWWKGGAKVGNPFE